MTPDRIQEIRHDIKSRIEGARAALASRISLAEGDTDEISVAEVRVLFTILTDSFAALATAEEKRQETEYRAEQARMVPSDDYMIACLVADRDALKAKLATAEAERQRLFDSITIEKKWRKDAEDRMLTAEAEGRELRVQVRELKARLDVSRTALRPHLDAVGTAGGKATTETR